MPIVDPLALRRRRHCATNRRDAVLLFEPGRYPVADFPIADVAGGALRPIDHRTTHPDLDETAWFEVIGDAQNVAWSYRARFDDIAAIGDLVSFEPDRVEVTLDGERLELDPGHERRLARHRPQPGHR